MPRPSNSEIKQQRGPDWVTRPERSNTLALRFMAWAALALGRVATRLLLYPICVYFLACSGAARRASRAYLLRVTGHQPDLADSFHHFHTFAATILDRVYLLNDQFSRFDVRVHGAEIVDGMQARGEGGLLVGAHLGSFEIVRTLARARGLRVNLVMYEQNARKTRSVLDTIRPELRTEIIALGNVDSMLRVEAALAAGEMVGMLGDRTIQGEGTLSCFFLGEQARFPAGPFRIAAMLRRPVVLMLGLYHGGNRYEIHFERLSGMASTKDRDREELIERTLEAYVERLEHYCRVAPYNWFNFYEFWR